MSGVREVFLKQYIGRGQEPTLEHFGIRAADEALNCIQAKVYLRVKTLFLGMSPSLRFRLNEDSNETGSLPRVDEGSTLATDGVGVIVESTSSVFDIGDIIANKPYFEPWPWRDHVVFSADSDLDLWYKFVNVTKNGESTWSQTHPEAALTCFGISGITSYLGITQHLEPQPGQTLVVSGASGACGSIAGQVGKILGFHRVVGVVSSADKISFLKEELGFDDGVVYKGRGMEELTQALSEACHGGVDCYFDNVGGDVSSAVASLMHAGTRVAICGQMSQMKNGGADLSWLEIVEKQGARKPIHFRYSAYKDEFELLERARKTLLEWSERGQLRVPVEWYDGLEQASALFVALFSSSQKIGKALVRV